MEFSFFFVDSQRKLFLLLDIYAGLIFLSEVIINRSSNINVNMLCSLLLIVWMCFCVFGDVCYHSIF